MKNLITAFKKQQSDKRKFFISNLKDFNDIEGTLSNWRIKPLLTAYKRRVCYWSNIKDLKAFLIKRFDLRADKELRSFVYQIQGDILKGVDTLLNLNISVTWKKSRTWGSNPTAEIYYTYKDSKGEIQGNTVYSRSVSGCGYDKESTAIAEALNQIDPLIKAMYRLKAKHIKNSNHNIFGYGSGYGLLPHFEGGVGVSCYPTIFAKLGLKWASVANGPNFNVYSVAKK